MDTNEMMINLKKTILLAKLRTEKSVFSYIGTSKEKLHDGSIKEVYVISFYQDDYVEYGPSGEIKVFGEGRLFWALFNIDTNKLIYIETLSVLIYPDGSRAEL